jgi:prophage maintenance system killer protein
MEGRIIFLDIAHVQEGHRAILEELGVPLQPLASISRLEGALSRVRQLAYYRSPSIYELAAMTAISISQAQAFVDGNKRAAGAALDLFLWFNGYLFSGNWMQVALFLEINALLSEVPNRGDEPREKGLQAFALWLESVVVPRE